MTTRNDMNRICMDDFEKACHLSFVWLLKHMAGIAKVYGINQSKDIHMCINRIPLQTSRITQIIAMMIGSLRNFITVYTLQTDMFFY